MLTQPFRTSRITLARTRSLLAAIACLLPLGCQQQPAEYEYRTEFLLTAHLEHAEPVGEERHPLSAPKFAIGHDQRRVLAQYAPSEYRMPSVPAGPGAIFRASPMLNPKAWTKPTDGVRFQATCSAADGSALLLIDLLVAPIERPEDRAWLDQEAPLDGCSSPTTELTLKTSCGEAGNCSADWSAWGDPRIEYSQRLPARQQPLVLLISIDTLRADRMGLYGGNRVTSPELERLAGDGITFDTAISSAPWTIPSHATMLTSTYPRVHGADSNNAIPQTMPMLPQTLQQAGWQTAGFIDTPYLSRNFGFDRGFDHFDDAAAPRGDYRRGGRVTRQHMLHWLQQAEDRPTFLFWHIMDVHGPYAAGHPHGGSIRDDLEAPPETDPQLAHLADFAYHDYLKLPQYSSFEDLVAHYDEGIAEADSVVGDLLQALRDTQLYDDALIVVTSDHGESFLDYGIWAGHGLFLTDDEMRVPLIIKLPGNLHAGSRVAGMVGVLDIAPTILDALGVAMPADFQGQSLISPSPGHPDSLPKRRFGFSSNTGASMLRTDRIHYISEADLGAQKIAEVHLKSRVGVPPRLESLAAEQLFETTAQGLAPADQQTHSAQTLEGLRRAIADHIAASAQRRSGASGETPQLSEEELERLRSLGYVD